VNQQHNDLSEFADLIGKAPFVVRPALGCLYALLVAIAMLSFLVQILSNQKIKDAFAFASRLIWKAVRGLSAAFMESITPPKPYPRLKRILLTVAMVNCYATALYFGFFALGAFHAIVYHVLTGDQTVELMLFGFASVYFFFVFLLQGERERLRQ
jgi:hypothetical protein